MSHVFWKYTRPALLAVLVLASKPGLAAETLPVVKVPLSPWTVTAAKKGWLQEAFAKLGSKVELVEPGTTALLGAEAALLDRGDLHFANRMIYPALVHKANGIDAQIIWLSGRSNVYRAPVIALKDSPIQNVSDLKGKVLGSGRVGCGWSSPWEIFYQAGIPLDSASKKGSVRFQNISNGAAGVSALLGGKIDASATHPTLVPWAAPVAQGLVKVVGRSPADGVYVNDAGRIALFAMRDFIAKYPQHVQAFLQVKNRTAAWIQANPDAAAGIIARETRVPVYIAKFAIVDQAQTEFPDGEPSAEAAIRSIKNFQDWYASHGDDILEKKRLDVATLREFVAKPFFQGGQYSAYDSAGKPVAAR